MNKPILGITMGDPFGNGPEITVKALADKPAKRWESLVGYGLSALAGAFLLWVASGMPGLK